MKKYDWFTDPQLLNVGVKFLFYNKNSVLGIFWSCDFLIENSGFISVDVTSKPFMPEILENENRQVWLIVLISIFLLHLLALLVKLTMILTKAIYELKDNKIWPL
jgi:hypothetical protein